MYVCALTTSAPHSLYLTTLLLCSALWGPFKAYWSAKDDERTHTYVLR